MAPLFLICFGRLIAQSPRFAINVCRLPLPCHLRLSSLVSRLSIRPCPAPLFPMKIGGANVILPRVDLKAFQ
jgi:hypothetical protein